MTFFMVLGSFMRSSIFFLPAIRSNNFQLQLKHKAQLIVYKGTLFIFVADMIRKTAGILFKFSKASKIPRPRDPTVAESFQTKLTDQQIKILIDPKGFMSEEDRQLAEANKPQQNLQQAAKSSKKPMEPQYGYKPKGPQPTRFGDWQVKGKCVDF